jgi:hypothetical protein
MDLENSTAEGPVEDAGGQAAAGPRRSSRRQMLRAAALTGGLAAAMYVKPNARELGVPGAYASVSPGLANPPGNPGGGRQYKPGTYGKPGGGMSNKTGSKTGLKTGTTTSSGGRRK